jgi:hypothetical protein
MKHPICSPRLDEPQRTYIFSQRSAPDGTESVRTKESQSQLLTGCAYRASRSLCPGQDDRHGFRAIEAAPVDEMACGTLMLLQDNWQVRRKHADAPPRYFASGVPLAASTGLETACSAPGRAAATSAYAPQYLAEAESPATCMPQ